MTDAGEWSEKAQICHFLITSLVFFQTSLENVDTGSVPSDMDRVVDGCFTYRETFPELTPTDGPFTVTIWTIVSLVWFVFSNQTQILK